MADMDKILDARAQLEAAFTNYIRITRDEEQAPYMFLQDYVVAIVSEDMREGKSGVTHFNFIAPENQPKYSIRGLLSEALEYYKSNVRSCNE